MITPQQVIEDVARCYDIQPDDILSKKRTEKISDARAIVCYILMHDLHLSSTDAGNVVNRNHATALHSVKKVEDMLSAPNMYRFAVNVLLHLEHEYFNAPI